MKLNINNTPALTSSNIQSTGFGMEVSAKTFKIFTSSIYKYKIRAIIRELYSNGVDGLIALQRSMVSIEEKTIEIHMPTALEPNFILRDYGTGMSHDFMFSTYRTYFASTKNDNNEEIGGLGLGCKSPLCYVSTFTVSTFVNGTKRVYSVFMADSGKPDIALMGEFKTDEPNGVEVRVPVQADDFKEFEIEAERLLPFFDYQPKFYGQNKLEIKPIVFDETDVLYNIHTSYDMKVGAVMGGVVYPIPDELTKNSIVRVLGRLNCFIRFGIGELDFQPSREELSLDKPTIRNISAKLKNIDDEYVCFYERVLAESKSIRDFYKKLKHEFAKDFCDSRNISFDLFWKWVHSRLILTDKMVKSWGKTYSSATSNIRMIHITNHMDVRLICMRNDRTFSERKIRRYRYSWVPINPECLTKIESKFDCVVINDLGVNRNNRTKVMRGLNNLGVCDFSNNNVLYFNDEYTTSHLLEDLTNNFEEVDNFKVIRMSEWHDRSMVSEKEFLAEQKRIEKENRSKSGITEREQYAGVYVYHKKHHNDLIFNYIKKRHADISDMSGYYVEKDRYEEIRLLSQLHPDLKNANVWILPKSFLPKAQKNENLVLLNDAQLSDMLNYAALYHTAHCHDFVLPLTSWERDLVRNESWLLLDLNLNYLISAKNTMDMVKDRSGSPTSAGEWYDLFLRSAITNDTIKKNYRAFDEFKRSMLSELENGRTEYELSNPIVYYWLKNTCRFNQIEPHILDNLKKITKI